MNAPIVRPRIPEIVHRPDLVQASKKGTLALIAAVGWLIWLYMLMPLATVLAWSFGYQRMDIFVLTDPAGTMQTLATFSLIISAGGIVFILWAVYNWLRFRHNDRRGSPPPADSRAIALAFAIPSESVHAAQKEKTLDFRFNDDGQITGIEPHIPAPRHESIDHGSTNHSRCSVTPEAGPSRRQNQSALISSGNLRCSRGN
ncbi:MAG: poly-beta-1,6-N-acetyl-D-glucosamine biosynthesis protein PgaD [Halothiobacillus sp.]